MSALKRGDMNEHYTLKKILTRGILTGLFFTALWSTWAYYVNLAHGAIAAEKAAITQGSFTIINAFLYTVIMEYMFALAKTALMRFVLAFLLPNSIVAVVLTSLHHFRGTPNVLATVAPSLIIIASLSLIYVLIVGPRKMRSTAAPASAEP
ncbi:MAG: hypothetical protein K8S54_11785 [Spirochaetia bacterium]|nr:hypothetical protein [Spirochaetia bacterium]